MKKPIVLIGSGQHARVVMYNIMAQGEYEVVTILDGDTQKIGYMVNDIPVSGTYDCNLDELRRKLGTNLFFIGFGNMKYRAAVYNRFVQNGWRAVTVIHPNAVVSPDARIGDGVLIECGCLITPNPVLGNNVVVNTGSQVNHDNIVEDHVYLASGVVMSGGVHIKRNTLIDDGVIVTLGRSVGENCLIGAGCVVTRDLDDGYIYYGNPARKIRRNEPEGL